MSATSQSFSSPAPDVLGQLLHSLSQPLTTLCCSLEMSIDEVAEKRQSAVSTALEQAERVISLIQLMREYLEAEQPGAEASSTALAPGIRSVTEALASIADVHGVHLLLVGTCTAMLPLPASRLRLALQYLIAAMIDAHPPGAKILLLLGEGPAGTVLRAEADYYSRASALQVQQQAQQQAAAPPLRRDAPGPNAALRNARLAIASRVLETAGASLVFASAATNGFVLRIPRPLVPCHSRSIPTTPA